MTAQMQRQDSRDEAPGEMRQTAIGGQGEVVKHIGEEKKKSMDLAPCVIRCRPIRDIIGSLEVTQGLEFI